MDIYYNLLKLSEIRDRIMSTETTDIRQEIVEAITEIQDALETLSGR